MAELVFCWRRPAAYMRACWEALQDAGIDFHVVAEEVPSEDAGWFSGDRLKGLPHTNLSAEELDDPETVESVVGRLRPAVVVLPGWRSRGYRRLTQSGSLHGARFVLVMDNQLRRDWRQALGRRIYGGFLSRIDHVMVPGERGWQFARYLGFRSDSITKGMYGIDFGAFKSAVGYRDQLRTWPRVFGFSGKYIERKGLDVLVSAYMQYRASVEEPWDLVCCGVGPLQSCLQGVEGVRDLGPQHPDAMPQTFGGMGAFVLPSRFDSWGQALVEAAAAGLPMIATETCGATVELMRSYANGLTVEAGDAGSLSRGLVYLHRLGDSRLEAMGRVSSHLAEPYGAQEWAGRIRGILSSVA